jgi:hypothetical protein
MPTRISALAAGLLASLWLALPALSSPGEEGAWLSRSDWPDPPRSIAQPASAAPRSGTFDTPFGSGQGSGQISGQRSDAGHHADTRRVASDDAYHPPRSGGYEGPAGAGEPSYGAPREDAYQPQRAQGTYGPYGGDQPSGESRDDAYRSARPQAYDSPYGAPRGGPPPYAASPQGSPQGYGQGYGQGGYGAPHAPPPEPPSGYGRPYAPPGEAYNGPPDAGYSRYDGPPPRSYSSNEILDAGHAFFGSISKGLASAIEYVFQKQGRPNGYILGQDAGGAFVAGLRFGEGTLYTRDAGTRRVYWQGPSIGWDAGAEGSKVMMLVYNLADPEEIYQRLGGVDGSAYLVGGAGVTFQKSGDVIVAPIRAGVGLRLGANIGYLKYTRAPTWNPF